MKMNKNTKSLIYFFSFNYGKSLNAYFEKTKYYQVILIKSDYGIAIKVIDNKFSNMTFS